MSAGVSRRLDLRGRQSSKIMSAISAASYPATPAEGYALTQANFPGLKEAFFDDGITGNDIVGEFGTVTITSSTGWTLPDTGQFRRNSGGTVTVTGAWDAIGNKHAVLLAIGSFTPGSGTVTRLGAAPGTGSQIAIATTSTNNISGPSAGNSCAHVGTSLIDPVLAMAMRLDQSTVNGHGYQYFYDGTNSEGPIVETVLTGDISANWPAFGTGASAAVLAISTSAYYTGIFFLIFEENPTDSLLAGALPWMAAHPKKLYPGFYRRS